MGCFMHNNFLKHHLIRPTNETNHVYVFVSILSGDCLSNLALVIRKCFMRVWMGGSANQ